LSANSRLDSEQLKRLIREVPDFPKKGILFYDITTVLKDKVGFATLVDRLSEHYIDQKVDLVLGMEARGFIFAPALAYRLNAGFVPVRKVGKLPAATVKFDYHRRHRRGHREAGDFTGRGDCRVRICGRA
jgi:adenine phosphoribosyltransferase